MGRTSAVLQPDSDYDLGEDGIISLKVPVEFGDVLRAMYVARKMQDAGTVFDINFAKEIVPNSSNGIAGQHLRMDYNLYAPDSFFYRVETVVTMLPEAKEAAVRSNSASSYGPNTQNAQSSQTKNAGLPCPRHDAAHYRNLDVVVQRFLKFHHDLIETYEDTLQLIDGRVVGGESGRFRYDGILSNPPRESYSAVTNDIDDVVKLYGEVKMSSSYPHTEVYSSVYGKMSDPNDLSRLFPTTLTSASFTSNTSSAYNGQQVGSFKMADVTSVGVTTTARAAAFFTSATFAPGGTRLELDSSLGAQELLAAILDIPGQGGKNGDSETLTPSFKDGMKVQVFDLDGNQVAHGAVSGATGYSVVIDADVPVHVGSVAQTPADWIGDRNFQNIYVPGLDYSYNPSNGQILFFDIVGNHPLAGSEVIEAKVSFRNASPRPARLPALFGKETNDSGRIDIPRRRGKCELRYLSQEMGMLRIGYGKHESPGQFVSVEEMFGVLQVGDSIQFIDGPNAGCVCAVTSIDQKGIYVNPAPNSIDAVGSNFVVGSTFSMKHVLNAESAVLTNELSKLSRAAALFGPVATAGRGTAAGGQWTAMQDLSGSEGKLLWVTSGPGAGLWKIQSTSGKVATVDSAYPQLVPGPGNYCIIDPWVFLQEAEFQFVANFYRSTLEFLSNTQAWSASMSAAGAGDRLIAITDRQSVLQAMAGQSGSLTSLLTDGDNLYDTRYMWIDQRTNKESGLMQMQRTAEVRAAEIVEKVTENQRKVLMLDAMVRT
jgi:hypothetical protein